MAGLVRSEQSEQPAIGLAQSTRSTGPVPVSKGENHPDPEKTGCRLEATSGPGPQAVMHSASEMLTLGAFELRSEFSNYIIAWSEDIAPEVHSSLHLSWADVPAGERR
jgi:hypothetical protein